MVTYDIQDPEDNSTYTLYGINKYTDLVYKSTRKAHMASEKRGEEEARFLPLVAPYHRGGNSLPPLP